MNQSINPLTNELRFYSIQGDGWSIFFTCLLGISNGYFGSVPMIMAPSRVPDEFKELGGNIMMWSYSVGLTTGKITGRHADRKTDRRTERY